MSAPAVSEVPGERARAWDFAALVLTAGQVFWWHNDDPHRSVISFVMTLVWVCALTVVMTRPVQRLWREADELERLQGAQTQARGEPVLVEAQRPTPGG